jgi:hypothetical protein
MADAKVMDMTTMSVLDSDGFTALYNAGELHEPGSLPPGVPFRQVVATDAVVASANPHAQQPKPAELKAEVKAEAKTDSKSHSR